MSSRPRIIRLAPCVRHAALLIMLCSPLLLAACTTEGGPPPPMVLTTDSTFETTPPAKVDEVGSGLEADETIPPCDDGTAKEKIAELKVRLAAVNAQEAAAEARVTDDDHALTVAERGPTFSPQIATARDNLHADQATVTHLRAEANLEEGEIHTLEGLKPCDTKTASSQTVAPTGTSTASATVEPLSGPVMAAVLAVNYAHSFPNTGAATDTWNVGGAVILGSSSFGLDGVAAMPTQPWYAGNLDVTASWGQSYVSHFTTSTATVGGSYDMIAGMVRFGPAVGYQSSSTDSFSSNTVNYGGYAEWYVTQRIDAFIKGGGFTTHPDSGGWYVGGSVKGYVCPKFAVNGGIDYTRYNGLGGFHDTTFTVGAEYLFSQTTPVSIYAGYSYDTAGYDSSFSSFSSHASEVYVGLKGYLNGPTVMTLEDRQRNGEPPAHQFGF